MYDIIGDVHGCFDELNELLDTLGVFSPTYNRTVVFAGDLTDRGPKNVPCLDMARMLCHKGLALMTLGNHDDKLRRWLRAEISGTKNNIKVAHGLSLTLKELEKFSVDGLKRFYNFLDGLPWKLHLDDGDLIVAHAGLPEKFHSMDNKAARSAALYGVTTGKTVGGFPERIDWAEDYKGAPVVVHGHVVHASPVVKNNVYAIDTGCVFGGHLTALRYPEMTFTQVKARRAYDTSKDI